MEPTQLTNRYIHITMMGLGALCFAAGFVVIMIGKGWKVPASNHGQIGIALIVLVVIQVANYCYCSIILLWFLCDVLCILLLVEGSLY